MPLTCALGFFELGLYEDCLAELDTAGPVTSEMTDLRVMALLQLERWDEAAHLSLPMLEKEPTSPGWWIHAAYALRRSRSITEAEALLRNGLKLHPNHPLIQYNLACYACAQGRPEDAMPLLTRALLTRPGPTLAMALLDPDLADLHPWILQQSTRPLRP